jgi:hypothetical protein
MAKSKPDTSFNFGANVRPKGGSKLRRGKARKGKARGRRKGGYGGS